MKQIKLEVGKTYVNRRGEEVRIIAKPSGNYQGDNGSWYVENGKWSYSSWEYPDDLIAEVPETRHTFKIPGGVKESTVSKEGNRIIVEMVPGKAPKPGDVMVNEKGSVYVFRGEGDSVLHDNYCVLFKDGKLGIGCQNEIGRPATAEEAQPLWDALKKAGKKWNAETMQVEDVPERERIMEHLQGYVNNATWNYEQLCLLIEGYLNRKEDKNEYRKI